MHIDTTVATRPVPPAMIGAALDRLAHLRMDYRLGPDIIIAVARAIGCSDAETPALLSRIRAAAIVMNDSRWPAWPAQMMTATVEERQAFDAVMLRTVAGLPLSADLTFDADAFFAHLLGSVRPRGRA